MRKRKDILKILLFSILLNLFVVGVSAESLLINPQIQHKDTKMLCLEGCNLTGNDAWDKPHDEDRIYPHGENYCLRACISMINSYYQEGHIKKLSQDYISYKLFKDMAWGDYDANEPEGDLGHNKTILLNDAEALLMWALKNVEIEVDGTNVGHVNLNYVKIREKINEKHPFIFCNNSHFMVLSGYNVKNEDDRQVVYVTIIDPWDKSSTERRLDDGGEIGINDDFIAVWGWWVANEPVLDPLKDPKSISIDSDGDGIVDFDEEMRFSTLFKNPDTDKDTDKDCLPDKLEIQMYTFIYDDTTEKYVFDQRDTKKPYADTDGIRAEKDINIQYGIESCDINKNIKYQFIPDEKVYVKGNKLENDSKGDIYVFYNQMWKDKDKLVYPGHDCLAEIYDVEAQDGVFKNGPIELGIVKNDVPPFGYFPYPAEYDIVYDRNQNNIYDEDVDLIDKVTCAGFETIPEFITIAIPSAIAFGLIFLISLRKRNE